MQRRTASTDPEIRESDWKETFVPPCRKEFVKPSPGPTHRFGNGIDGNMPKTYFDLYFTNEVWEMMVVETNRYYAQQYAEKPDKHKTEWHDTTKEELQAFVGVLILMGIARLPSFEQYWNENIYTNIPGISGVFTRKRFLQIWRYFHLADNNALLKRGSPGYDKIGKVRAFLNVLATACEADIGLIEKLPLMKQW